MRCRNLDVYNKSYELALSIYRFSEILPESERYGIISQIKRASLSIPLNIAEGYGKQSSDAEMVRFLQMAKGSCSEMGVLLDFLKDLGILKEEHHKKYHECYEEIEKMLHSLITLKKK